MSTAAASTMPARGGRATRRRGGGVNTLPLVGPSVVLLLIFSIVPLIATLYFSVLRYNLVNPLLHGFAGFSNYRFLFQDPGSTSRW